MPCTLPAQHVAIVSSASTGITVNEARVNRILAVSTENVLSLSPTLNVSAIKALPETFVSMARVVKLSVIMASQLKFMETCASANVTATGLGRPARFQPTTINL